MAVGTPIAGTTSGSNGASLTVAFPIGMGIVADDIVVMFAIFYANSGTVPTAIDWTSALTGAPAGWTWTEQQLVQVKDSGGTVKGVAGWAWARATGSFNGSCGSISGNGTSGANSGALMQSVKIPGCVTSGDPFEDEQANNPNYTSTVDWPAASMNRSTTGRSVIALLNSDNVNIGTSASWTTLTSNASTQGLDSGLDIDHRAPGATGTYDPANGSMGANNNLGWATFHIIFTDTAPSGGTEALASTPAGVASVTANLTERVSLAGAPAGGGSVVAGLTERVPLAGAPAGGSSVTAGLSERVHLSAQILDSGIVKAGGVVTASLTERLALACSPAGAATVAANLTVTGGAAVEDLAASVAGIASVSASLTEHLALAATVAGVGLTTANLSERVQLAAAVVGTSTIAANLRERVSLAAAPAGVSVVTATLTERVRLAAAFVCGSSVTADLGGTAPATPATPIQKLDDTTLWRILDAQG